MKILELSVDALQGVGEKIKNTLESVNIKTVGDLADIDILEYSKKLNIPEHILVEHRKKARLLRGLIFDAEVIEKLQIKKLTLQQMIEQPIKKLTEITGLSEKAVVKFLDKVALLTVVMDVNKCRELPVESIQTDPYVSETGELADKVDIKEVNELADQIFENLPPKVAFVGFSGTGKTTIGNLIQNEEFPKTHLPTMTLDIDNIEVGGMKKCILFDCAGQEQFSFLWDRFIKNSDAIFIIVDSQPDNVKQSKFFIDQVKKETPKTPVAIIANKQDLPKAMNAKQIEEILGGYRTLPLVAIERKNREKILYLIADLLKLSPEIKNQIPSQIKSDTIIREAEIVTQYSDNVVKEIKSIEKDIVKVEKEMTGLKKNLKKDLSIDEAQKLRVKLVISKAKLRNKQREINAIKLRSDTCSCLSSDIHQGMRNVSYIVQCKCGHIYKKLYEINRGTDQVILKCPLCETEYIADESTWKELRMEALK